MNKLKNLSTGEELKRLYTDEELDQTFSQPEKSKLRIIKKAVKPKFETEQTIAKTRQKRVPLESETIENDKNRQTTSRERNQQRETKIDKWKTTRIGSKMQ